MNLSDKLAVLPPLLRPETERLWQDYLARVSEVEQTHLKQQPQILDSLLKVWACSPFVARHCVQYPTLLTDLIESGDLVNVPTGHSQHLLARLTSVEDEIRLMQILREYRRREMIRIAWRDLAGWATLEETFRSLSDLADATLEAAVTVLYQQLSLQWGTPCNAQGTPQQLVVLGLGKLGGQELNFSSDIDLMFAYPEKGYTLSSKRPRENQEFFVRLCQQIIHVLSHLTPDGLVFRVDMRLRPFGDSGPLVMNFTALEDYYQTMARDWERYALIKARVSAGDKRTGQTLLTALRPFVYRRYLDYNTFESLRTMKELIDQETRRKGWENNIKLGSGGIREIEFICQAFQLIRGGRQPALQQQHLLTTLQLLETYQLLPQEIIPPLREAYIFLRCVENRLQAVDDRQTHTLPQDVIQQARLIYSLGFNEWRHFMTELQRHQEFVHQQFELVVKPLPSQTIQTTVSPYWRTLWQSGLQEDTQAESLSLLVKAGFRDAPSVLTHLRQFAHSYSVYKLSNRGRERLDILLPLLLATVCKHSCPDDALHRTLGLIESVAQRSVYLSLLIERPQVLELLVSLCADSTWITEQITRYPLLLDELLDPRRLYDPLKPEELDNALQAQLAHLPADDLEMQMDSMRQFKRAYVLHVATAEITGNLIVEVASDYLAAIADTLTRSALAIAWDHLVQKHGYPCYRSAENTLPAHFCVVAYGKAGGIELSYDSDLDIVFLHDSQGTEEFTNGDKPLDNSVFFARLAKRIIHILSTNTPAGILYEVDPRLRPGGNSGLLVSSLEAFATYQREDAWTWEHQALIRARVIAGHAACQTKFEKIRWEVLSQPRETLQLKAEVRDMRAKMRSHLDKSSDTHFDIKQGTGGITDIEFIVQYGVLNWAANYPSLLDTTGVLPVIKMFRKYELLDAVACEQLGNAYRTYRTEVHRLALQNQAALVPQTKFNEYRQHVIHWWKYIMEDN